MVPIIFQLIFSLDIKTKTMNIALKIMKEGNACFQHLKNYTSPFIEFFYSLAAKPNQVSSQAFGKNIDMAIIFHPPPCMRMCLKRLQWYPSYSAEIFSVKIVHLLGVLMSSIFIICPKKLHKIYPCTVTKIREQPLN